MSLVVRPALAADVPRIEALLREVLSEFGLVFGEGSETDAQVMGLPSSYAEHGGAFWVAELEGELCGTCGVFPVGPGAMELRKMYLAYSARGRGVGVALLDEAKAFARAAGAQKLVLDTTEQMKAAIAFYEREGFVRDDAEVRGARCSRGYVLAL